LFGEEDEDEVDAAELDDKAEDDEDGDDAAFFGVR
jgi:hypothetical protein